MSAIRKTWRIEGMHCPHCETAVRRALIGVSGLSEVNVSFPNGTLTALWDEKLLQEIFDFYRSEEEEDAENGG